MSKEITSKGESYSISHLNRETGGSERTILRVNGTDGSVDLGDMHVSPSGRVSVDNLDVSQLILNGSSMIAENPSAIYIDTAGDDSDLSDGGISSPFASLEYAISRAPGLYKGGQQQFLVNPGSYDAPSTSPLNLAASYGVGTLPPLLKATAVTIVASKVADVGSLPYAVKVQGAGLVVNAHRGQFLRMLTGATAGFHVIISDNTADTIFVNFPLFFGVADGDTFQIETTAVTFSGGGGFMSFLGNHPSRHVLLKDIGFEDIDVYLGPWNGNVKMNGCTFKNQFVGALHRSFMEGVGFFPLFGSDFNTPAGASFDNCFVLGSDFSQIGGYFAFVNNSTLKLVDSNAELYAPVFRDSKLESDASKLVIFANGFGGTAPAAFDGSEGGNAQINLFSKSNGFIGGFGDNVEMINAPGSCIKNIEDSMAILFAVTGSTGNAFVGLETSRGALTIYNGDVTVTGAVGDTLTGNTNRTYGAIPVQGPVATGSITAVAGASLVDGETFTIEDGVNPATVFEFDDNAAVTPGNVAVAFTGADTAATVAATIEAAINSVGAGLLVTASAPVVATVPLTNDAAQYDDHALGNVDITDTVADAGFVVSGMSGGSNAAGYEENGSRIQSTEV